MLGFCGFVLSLLVLVMGSTIDESCTCGASKTAAGQTDSRIVGGVEAQRHAYNWLGHICFPMGNGAWHCYCGAALVTSQHLLTAAHCVCPNTFYPSEFQDEKGSVFVQLGDHNKKDIKDARTMSYTHVGYRICHEGYNPTGNNQFKNDIAVIRLESPVIFGNYGGRVGTLCLNRNILSRQDNLDVSVAGWGLTEEDGSNSDYLKVVELKTMTLRDCSRTGYKDYWTYFSNGMICAGPPSSQTRRDACQGDSGGPLFTKDLRNGRYYQVGLVSWGLGCAQQEFPGVFSRLSFYWDWIMTQLADGVFCADQ
ncbi:venom protease isoform X2 [Eurytemora carolleeae]|uniref:venom protease isoform X2 n=1 Tax=Eurytemora carolleeae TaxID=1294199 RepID=UPI000C78FA59|nr:venom protease isoform X2 [Eurytemora carolleeae]|eukprot:XP_023344118.1 venom protease-like isoform X2 [Eurytemora affinis]